MWAAVGDNTPAKVLIAFATHPRPERLAPYDEAFAYRWTPSPQTLPKVPRIL